MLVLDQDAAQLPQLGVQAPTVACNAVAYIPSCRSNQLGVVRQSRVGVSDEQDGTRLRTPTVEQHVRALQHVDRLLLVRQLAEHCAHGSTVDRARLHLATAAAAVVSLCSHPACARFARSCNTPRGTYILVAPQFRRGHDGCASGHDFSTVAEARPHQFSGSIGRGGTSIVSTRRPIGAHGRAACPCTACRLLRQTTTL
jgi:hypothetical protein